MNERKPVDETRMNARLPNLDIEILRRKPPEERAEMMTGRMRATPSFGAVGGHLARTFAGLVALMWAAPMVAWARADASGVGAAADRVTTGWRPCES